MAKAAFATWNERIAPVFDVARTVQLVEIQDEQIVHQEKIGLTGELANLKAACLAELGVSTLVCGAISRPLQQMISAYGIQVIAFVAGNLQEVIQAWIGGGLMGSRVYAMPGCRKKRGQGAGNTRQEAGRMESRKGAKKGVGQGTGKGGQGRKGQGRGRGARSSGPQAGGATASRGNVCVCTQCGYQEPHGRGVPCTRTPCPRCGAVMIRQDEPGD